MPIKSFKNQGTADIAFGLTSKKARALLPQVLHELAYLKLRRIDAACSISDLALFPGDKFERLKADRKDQYSVRINKQYRICFYWSGHDAFEVEITDYH
ncbi:MAG: type II toxin-antitoxin system RelE/ParE family toxin [Proteobacteria bacterium]|nr:type II toxin-antitoxin system RelE/ParE family toxin [Pseudomonadota bacterium]